MWKLQPPPEKIHHPLSQQPPLKVEVLSSPPFLKIWLEAQAPPPTAERFGGGRGGFPLSDSPNSNSQFTIDMCQKINGCEAISLQLLFSIFWLTRKDIIYRGEKILSLTWKTLLSIKNYVKIYIRHSQMNLRHYIYWAVFKGVFGT